jgi:hypothetical protein
VNTGAITNNAALGASVTVKGSGNKLSGRIFGFSAPGNYSYAIGSMELRTSSTYGDASPGTSSPSNSITGKDGQTTALNDFRRTDFWLDTGGLSFNYTGGGISGITNVWDFSGIAGRGYPALSVQ